MFDAAIGGKMLGKFAVTGGHHLGSVIHDERRDSRSAGVDCEEQWLIVHHATIATVCPARR